MSKRLTPALRRTSLHSAMPLLLQAVRNAGTFDPELAMPFIEELLTPPQEVSAEAFLSWCHRTGTSFGHGNYERRVEEYLTWLDG